MMIGIFPRATHNGVCACGAVGLGWDISYCARTKSQSIGNHGGDGEKGSGLGYKRHSSPRSWEGRTAEESTSLCKPPSDTNDQAARRSTQSPLNTPPLELGPFSPPPHHHHCKIHQHRSRPARLQRPAHITIQASSGEIYRSSTGKPHGTERENRLGIPRLRGWEGLQYPSLTLRSDFRIQVTSWTSKNQFIQVGFKIRFHTSRIPVSSLG